MEDDEREPINWNDFRPEHYFDEIVKEKPVKEVQLFIPFLSREEWNAEPADKEGLQPLQLPVDYVRYTYTSTEKCATPEHCSALVQDLQKHNMYAEGLADVRYNFIIGGDGKVFVGRGWNYEADRAPEFDYLTGRCIDIAYIGNYAEQHPTWDMIKLGLDLLKHGLRNQYLNPSFEVIPYREETKPS